MGIGVSKEQLDQFLERFAEDDSLRGEFGEDRVSPAKIVELAARHGFQFTSEELLSKAKPLADDAWAEAARMFDGDHSNSYILFLEEAPMSKEALSAFFKKVADDEGMQKKLIEFAAAQGFEFSADELSDSDLDSVAGGLLSISTVSPTEIKIDNLVDIKIDDLADLDAQKLGDVKWENLGK